jgi:hypothetical protein
VIILLFFYTKYLLIQKFREVMDIEQDQIKIKMKDKIFIIKGENLSLKYFSKEELKIEGLVHLLEIIYD